MHDHNIRNESMTSTVLAWTVVVAMFATAIAMIWLS